MTAIPLTLLPRRPGPADGSPTDGSPTEGSPTEGSPAGGKAPAEGASSGGKSAPARGCATTSSCGTSSTGLDPALVARVANHPCYSQEAHRYYARMHIPVAPGCNIQCNYCNRKFDCANESRPGVTSSLLSPEQAVAKVKHVAGKVQQLSVVGIAGPGEPLANARRTIGTLELLARECPDITLCLSTNGLALLDHVDRIAALGVDHVTVTVNMTDPEVGERIYPWITFRGKRYTGREASTVLSQRQLEGIAALTDRGILCKVNSVLIPGVNDDHLAEVSRVVRGLGAFLHNVMPLVSAPEHGTVFGLAGLRGPTPQELMALQQRCERIAAGEVEDGSGIDGSGADGSGIEGSGADGSGADGSGADGSGADGSGADGSGAGMAMSMMRHCRQCRADAVGLLGDDRGEEFAALSDLDPADVEYDLAGRRETHARIEATRAEAHHRREVEGISDDLAAKPDAVVLVAVATSGGGLVNQHFGHADEFSVYEAGPGYVRLAGIRSVSRYCQGPSECDDDRTVLDRTVEMLSDCAAVLCSRAGAGPRHALAAAGIEVIEVYEQIEVAVAAAAARFAAEDDVFAAGLEVTA